LYNKEKAITHLNVAIANGMAIIQEHAKGTMPNRFQVVVVVELRRGPILVLRRA